MRDERMGFEAFDCAPALRLEAHERVSKLHNDALNRRIEKQEEMMERLEKRLWYTDTTSPKKRLNRSINWVVNAISGTRNSTCWLEASASAMRCV